MAVPNAFIIFLLAFSGITGWLMFRAPVPITVSNTETDHELQEKTEPAKEPQPAETSAVAKITPPTPQDDIYSQLDNTVLPLLDLSSVTLAEVVGFLEFRGREILASQSATSRSLHITVHHAEQESLHASMENSDEPLFFTFYAENMTFTEVLNLICEKTNSSWEADEYQVTVYPN